MTLAEDVSHEDVAPGRKTDTGPGFDWLRLARPLHGSRLVLLRARAPVNTRPAGP